MEKDDDNRFSFVRKAPVDQSALEKIISEEEGWVKDVEAAKHDHDRTISNWIECKVPWTRIFTKRELNLRPNEIRVDVHNNLWEISMETLLEHLIEESGKHRKCGYLPDVCSNSPCQLDVLKSERFSERMIITANILDHAHRTRLDHEIIDKMTVLRVGKRLMERVRREEAFTSISFQHSILFNEHVIPNEMRKY